MWSKLILKAAACNKEIKFILCLVQTHLYVKWLILAILFVYRVFWGSIPWLMERYRSCSQGFSRARSNCWKHGRLLQWDINSQVSCYWYVDCFNLIPPIFLTLSSVILCMWFLPAVFDILMVYSLPANFQVAYFFYFTFLMWWSAFITWNHEFNKIYLIK